MPRRSHFGIGSFVKKFQKNAASFINTDDNGGNLTQTSFEDSSMLPRHNTFSTTPSRRDTSSTMATSHPANSAMEDQGSYDSRSASVISSPPQVTLLAPTFQTATEQQRLHGSSDRSPHHTQPWQSSSAYEGPASLGTVYHPEQTAPIQPQKMSTPTGCLKDYSAFNGFRIASERGKDYDLMVTAARESEDASDAKKAYDALWPGYQKELDKANSTLRHNEELDEEDIQGDQDYNFSLYQRYCQARIPDYRTATDTQTRQMYEAWRQSTGFAVPENCAEIRRSLSQSQFEPSMEHLDSVMDKHRTVKNPDLAEYFAPTIHQEDASMNNTQPGHDAANTDDQYLVELADTIDDDGDPAWEDFPPPDPYWGVNSQGHITLSSNPFLGQQRHGRNPFGEGPA